MHGVELILNIKSSLHLVENKNMENMYLLDQFTRIIIN